MVRAYLVNDRDWTPSESGEHCPEVPQYGSDVPLEKLYAMGIKLFYVPIVDKSGSLQEICKELGYDYSDNVIVSKKVTHDYDEQVEQIAKEHMHLEDEARYVKDGHGFYDVRNLDDKWVRIVAEPGDLIVIPAGCYHRFMPDEQDYVSATRFFKNSPLWKPYYRCDIEEIARVRQEYVKSHSDSREEVSVPNES